MVEFALASLVLIPLFVGTFQFGYAFYVYNLLCTQTRAAARYASLKTFKCSNATKIADWKTAVKNTMRFGNPDGSGTVIEPGLDANEIDVQIKDKDGNDADATHVPAYVTVTTVNYGVNAVITTFNFTNKPFVRFPYAGRYAPAE
jgi:Flp pilus assembly protein TadG